MKRRDFLKMAAFGFTSAGMPVVVNSKVVNDKRPNIILFLTDDQDKHSIGAYGGKVWGPNLNRMAREGMVFHQAFVSSTVCTPSRYSFLTGRYAGRSYSDRYLAACPAGTQGFPSFNMTLEKDNMNVGNVLRQSGYVTGYVGKYHVGEDIKREDDYEERGLKFVARQTPANAASSTAFKANELWYRRQLLQRGFSWSKHIYWGNMQAPFNHHNSEWTIGSALEFIEQNKDRPFYLHYCTTLVHGPAKSWQNSMDHPEISGQGFIDASSGVANKRRAILAKLEKEGLDPSTGHAGYSWVDDGIGAIMKKLDALGIADNTLVVFVSDHGSRMKSSLFHKDGVNIPCIMRWPQVIKAGSECHELVQNIDMVPTFFDIAGAEVPDGYMMDGRSLVPLFKGEKPGDWRDHLYFEMGVARAVCTKEWKYIAVRYPRETIEVIRQSSPENLPKQMSYIGRMGIGTRGASNPNFYDSDQLYHIKDDSLELNNLANNPRYQRKLAEMKQILTKHLKLFGRPFGEFVPGGNAVAGGSVKEQIELVKRIKVEGKKVILPAGIKAGKRSGRKQR